MRRKIQSTIFAGISTLFLLFSGLRGITIKDVAKPYLGEYACQEARFNGEDYLKNFEYITLILRDDETFTLVYQEKNGEKKQTTGQYRYDKEKKQITIWENGRSYLKLDVPIVKGTMDVIVRFGGKTLHIKFKQKA